MATIRATQDEGEEQPVEPNAWWGVLIGQGSFSGDRTVSAFMDGQRELYAEMRFSQIHFLVNHTLKLFNSSVVVAFGVLSIVVSLLLCPSRISFDRQYIVLRIT